MDGDLSSTPSLLGVGDRPRESCDISLSLLGVGDFDFDTDLDLDLDWRGLGDLSTCRVIEALSSLSGVAIVFSFFHTRVFQ